MALRKVVIEGDDILRKKMQRSRPGHRQDKRDHGRYERDHES